MSSPPAEAEPVTPFAIALEPQEPRSSTGSSQPATKASVSACVDPTLACGALGRHLHGPNAAKHVPLVTYMRSAQHQQRIAADLESPPTGGPLAPLRWRHTAVAKQIAARPLIERWASTNRCVGFFLEVDGCGWTTGVGEVLCEIRGLTSLTRASFRRAAFEAEETGMADCGEPEMGGPGLRRPGLAPFPSSYCLLISLFFFLSCLSPVVCAWMD